MTDQPDEQEIATIAFYAELDLNVSYFPAIWHTFGVGHLMETDLNRICRTHGLSSADLHLLGAVRADSSGRLRATDLAHMLRVSNAVLSPRVAKLERKNLLVSSPSSTDRRAIELSLTPGGIAAIDKAIGDIGKYSSFVQSYYRLPAEDRAALLRILRKLHDDLYRNFAPRSRGNG
jgi:DNA-binding MarR family transcriptional regulator